MIRWFAGQMGQKTRRPSVWWSQVFFFHKILQNSLQKPFQFIFLSFHKISKMKIKSFESPKKSVLRSIRNYEKKILVDESFVQSAQRTSIVDCRICVPADLNACCHCEKCQFSDLQFLPRFLLFFGIFWQLRAYF